MSASTVPSGAPAGGPGPALDAPDIIVLDVVDLPVSRRRRLVTGALLVLVGVLVVVAFGLGSKSGSHAGYGLSQAGDAVSLPTITVPARLTCTLLGILVAAAGVWQIARGFSRKAMVWVASGALVAIVISLLGWATTGKSGTTVDVLGLLQQSLFYATPLILGALAGLLCERSGVINVAIEGQMLSGAWAGALFGTIAHSAGAGAVGAALAGGLLGLMLAFFAIRYQVNQIVLGVVLNLLAAGITGFIYHAIMQNNANSYNDPPLFSPVKIPLLGDIPFVGPLLFHQKVLVYVAYVIFIAVDIGLARTRWGLRTRAVGEHPLAADTVGINVLRVRYRNVVLGGFVAGLAGASLTVGGSGPFTGSAMSNGLGFIALAALIFGKWTARGAVLAALFFGFATELQVVLSFLPAPVTIPSYFLLMLPYLATIVAVAGLVGRVRAPAADGEPYVKGG